MIQAKSFLVATLAAAALAGPVFAQTYGEASGEVAVLAAAAPAAPAVSTQDVKAQVLAAQRAGTLSYGEASGERLPASPASGLTREDVRSQTLHAQREGTLSRHQW